MELRHLRYFVAVAEELNFRRAAEKLHMEQPPLSRQIRQLEQELQTELLHRTKQGVTLTEAGQAFLTEARLTLAQAVRSTQVVQQFNGKHSPNLTIGFSICVFDSILAKMIQSFREIAPAVEIILKEMDTLAQVQGLLAGELDVGFLYLTAQHPDLLTETVLREPLMVVLPENHPLAAVNAIELSSLAHEPFILFPREAKPHFYDLLIQLFQTAGFQPQIIQEVTPPEVAVSLVEAGAGISLVTAGTQHRHCAGVVYRNIAGSAPYLDIDVAWHRGQASEVLNQFLKIVRPFEDYQPSPSRYSQS
jgi:DNA-binding transcriptional LysR family regulator